MSRKTPPARFRLRTEDGSEVPVSTVEALARRVSRGDVLPDTPLFDAGPGAWGRAADSTVVRFILDQLKEEGKEIPFEWSADAPTVAPSSAPVAPPASDAPLTPDAPSATTALPIETSVPFAPPSFDFTLADFPGETATPEPSPSASDSPAPAAPPPPAFDMGPLELAPMEPEPRREPPPEKAPEPEIAFERPHAESSGDVRSVAPTDPGGLLADDLPSAATEWKPPKPAPEEPRGTGEVPAEATVASRSATAAREPAVAASGGAGSGSKAWIGIAVVVLAAAGGGAWFAFGGGGSGGAASPATVAAPLVEVPARPAPPPVPAGLEGAAEAALASYASRMDALVDSLRGAHAIVSIPARDWLSGNYLANASDFPAVREFWVDYGAVVEALSDRDRSTLQEVIAGARAPGDADGGSVLERYLTLRYEGAAASRAGRYEQLVAVAEEAVRFHDFLTANQGSFRYTPALGTSIPQDPVLEVQASTPELRADLFARLDGLLLALDRSRGGKPAPAGGLAVDLFEGFGEL